MYLRESTPDWVLRSRRNPHYRSLVLLLSACIFYWFVPRPVTVVHVVEKAPSPPPPEVKPLPIKFPELQVPGVVLNGGRSSAIVSRKVVAVGEDVLGASLVKVHARGAVAEFQGVQKEILFGRQGRG